MNRTQKETLIGYILLLPSLFFVGLCVIYPVLYNAWLSFHRLDVGCPIPKFVGFDQYLLVLSDIEVLYSFLRGTIYTVLTTVIQILIVLLLVSIANLKFRGRSAYRVLIVLPWAVPVISTAIGWKFMMWKEGVLNYLLSLIGLSPIPWLENANWALLGVVLVSIWRTLPFPFLCVLAAVQGIPTVLYEVAKIDGASSWQTFRYITLPSIKDTLAIVIILRAIFIFNWFDLPWLLTRGGPGTATIFPAQMIYLRSFVAYSLSNGATISMISTLILLIFAVIYLRIMRESA